jgi:hypothetical protein
MNMQQTQEMMKDMMASWSKTQKQMIDQWLEMVEEASGQQTSNMWEQTLSVWESTVKRTMEAQNASLNSWMSQMESFDGMPSEATERVKEGRTIVKQWTDAQSELWDNWFETMRQMDPAKYESGMEEMAHQSAGIWHNYIDQIQKMNENFASMAGSMTPDAE